LHLDNEGNTYSISNLEADVYFYRQVLTGDSTDGYPGCPGVGPKTAEKLIPEEDFTEASAWGTVIKQYEKKGFGPDYALTQARLARILRNTEYTFDELQLWTPLTIPSTPPTTPSTKE
jgi:DNA polymerase I